MSVESASSGSAFVWSLKRTLSRACPVCGDRGAKGHVVRSPSVVFGPVGVVSRGVNGGRGVSVESMSGERGAGMVDLYACGVCGLRVSDPPEPIEYEGALAGEAYASWYAEVGAGLDFMLWPVAVLAERRRIGTFLDVGCAMGFVVDYASRVLGAASEGVEPGAYGGLGPAWLGARVHRSMLESCEGLSGRRFDVVYSSEVLEHIAEPMVFLRSAARHLAADGVLILTTPNAERIGPGVEAAEAASTMAPGFHVSVFTRESLERALEAAGLIHRRIMVRSNRLIAWASRAPLPFGDEELVYTHGPAVEYARRVVELEASGREPVVRGMLYRLLRELVNEGRWEEAGPVRDRLVGMLRAAWGAECLERAWVMGRVNAGGGGGEGEGGEGGVVEGCVARIDPGLALFWERLPAVLIGVLVYDGTLRLITPGGDGYALAAERLGLAFELASRAAWRPWSSGHLGEWLNVLWPARVREGLALLLSGRREEAMAALRTVIEAGESGVRLGEAPVPDGALVAEACLHTGVACLQSGRCAEAVRWLTRAREGAARAGMAGMAAEALRVLVEATPGAAEELLRGCGASRESVGRVVASVGRGEGGAVPEVKVARVGRVVGGWRGRLRELLPPRVVTVARRVALRLRGGRG